MLTDCALATAFYESCDTPLSKVSLTDSADDRRVAPHRSAATWHLPTRTRTRDVCLVDRRSRLGVDNARLHQQCAGNVGLLVHTSETKVLDVICRSVPSISSFTRKYTIIEGGDNGVGVE